jgi:hypothetical protein
MAINVDKVYRVVLSIMNKEQRGYLTPDQFNRLGRQAQLDLLEKSFYDYNRHLTRRNIQGVNSEYGDIADNIQEKIDALSKEASITFTAGVYSTSSLSDDVYKIIQLTTQNRSVEVESVKKSELTYLNSSSLNQPQTDYPVYYYEGNNIKIFPTSITSATLDYIKVPSDPVWGYTGGGAAAYVYSSGASTDFELHPSEETSLVIKILSYAGIIIKDPLVVQSAQQQEVNTFNQENS